MDVAGHNIANVNREGYSRQRVELAARSPLLRSFGELGRGVQVQDITRLREDFLDTIYRQQVDGLGSAEIRATYFSRIEDLFGEPGPNGFSTRINEFFDALHDFANNVEEQPVRMSVLTEAQSLASSLNQIAQQIYALRTNANEEIRNMVPDINSLASRIAALNVNIRKAELGGRKSNDLRDERDLALDQLAKLINISYRERPDGQIDVFVSGDTLVSGEDYRQLVAERDPTLDPQRSDLFQVRYADNHEAVDVQDGQLYGALTARDTDLPQLAGRINLLASTVIAEVNRIHSTGNGLDNLSGTLSSTNRVTDPTASLSAAGLPFSVTPGTFDVIVYDAAGAPITTTITVTDSTTLESLAADLSAIPNFSASVTGGDTLTLGATSPNTFSFADDTSGVLVGLGINGLFTGYNAATMAVNTDITNNPRLLTSGYSTDVLDTGDNAAAIDLANVRTSLLLDNGTATISDFYESTIVRVGVDARANTQTQDIQKAFVDDFQRRRQEVSGVSIDEEVTQMLQFERGFEASARVITTVDRMLDALLNMVG
jgi:flagellar hook-associated protein 1 FlgK